LLFWGAGMHMFSRIGIVSFMVACNGRGEPALTGLLAPVMRRLKIHRLGGPLRGLFNTALKLPRWPDV